MAMSAAQRIVLYILVLPRTRSRRRRPRRGRFLVMREFFAAPLESMEFSRRRRLLAEPLEADIPGAGRRLRRHASRGGDDLVDKGVIGGGAAVGTATARRWRRIVRGMAGRLGEGAEKAGATRDLALAGVTRGARHRKPTLRIGP